MNSFQLVDEQVDSIIIAELQAAYEMNLYPGRDEGGFDIEPDAELLKSLEVVLQYYMAPSDFKQWKND